MNREQLLESQRRKEPEAAVEPHLEKHYRADELAKIWGVSPAQVRRLFQDEPGVLKMGRTEGTRDKQRYVTLLIPESVARRVHARLTLAS